MASLKNTEFQQIENKTGSQFKSLSRLALTYNTIESLVTKTQGWVKSTKNTQNFKTTIHVLESKIVVLKWLRCCPSFYCSLERLLFTLEKICLLLYSHVFFYISRIFHTAMQKEFKYMVLTAVFTSHNSSKLSHRNAALSDCAVMLKTKQNKTLPWEPSNISALTVRKHI